VTYRSGSFCGEFLLFTSTSLTNTPPFKGKEVLETVTLSPTLVVYNQSIGIAPEPNSGGFRGFDGVLG